MSDVKQQKREPQIIVGDFTNDELLEWMEAKLRAARHLKGALAEREVLRQALDGIESQISDLTSRAALELLDKN